MQVYARAHYIESDSGWVGDQASLSHHPLPSLIILTSLSLTHRLLHMRAYTRQRGKTEIE